MRLHTWRSRLLLAVLVCLTFAWTAQAAFATTGKVTVVKINNGGNASDMFQFTANLKPSAGSFSLAGGQQKTFSVECNASSSPSSCQKTKPVLQITEKPTAGYDLTGIVCRHRLDGKEPNTSAALDSDTTVTGGTINFKVFVKEWVKCWVTNTPKAPAITIDKTGPATAPAGSLVPYTLQVTNSGVQSFPAAGVTVTDALCQAAPTLTSSNGDATPSSLDPGETWTYGCSVQTSATATSVTNSGSVQAVDVHGHGASSTDQTTTGLFAAAGNTPTTAGTPTTTAAGPTPAIQVLPERIVPGAARIVGPSTCTRVPAVNATVTGRQITRVTFYVDGKRSRSLTRPDSIGRWRLSMQVRSFGTHRVRALVHFTRASGTQTKTLRLTFSRCRAAVVRPQFTG